MEDHGVYTIILVILLLLVLVAGEVIIEVGVLVDLVVIVVDLAHLMVDIQLEPQEEMVVVMFLVITPLMVEILVLLLLPRMAV